MGTNTATILIVDDSPADIQLASEFLKDRYAVRIATTPEKAVQIAMAEPHPDLILLDVLLPRMDGYELCQKLKQHPATKAIPIVFVTGNVSSEERMRGLDLGGEAFLSKPVDGERLMATLEQILG